MILYVNSFLTTIKLDNQPISSVVQLIFRFFGFLEEVS